MKTGCLMLVVVTGLLAFGHADAQVFKCSPGTFWNGAGCISGDAPSCPPSTTWNGTVCASEGHDPYEEERRRAAEAAREQEILAAQRKYAAEIAAREKAGALAHRRKVEAKGLPKDQTEKLIARRAWVGMPADLLRLAWGEPERVTSTSSAIGTTEVWWYGSSQMITLANGRVTSITQSR